MIMFFAFLTLTAIFYSPDLRKGTFKLLVSNAKVTLIACGAVLLYVIIGGESAKDTLLTIIAMSLLAAGVGTVFKRSRNKAKN